MKRPLRRFEVVYLAAVLGVGGACTPNNSVKPGAPVLTTVSIVEGGGATITNIPATAPGCPAEATAGNACFTTAPMCFELVSGNWCRCVANMAPAAPTPGPDCGGAGGAAGGAGGAAGAGGGGGAGGADGGSTPDAAADAAPPPDGTWNCDPFAPTAQVLFVFDRLLDSRPLDPGDGGTVTAAGVTAGGTPIASNVDYASNGSPGEFIFPAYGDFRAAGPSLLVSGAPSLPVNDYITVSLDPTQVRAKDGHTPFTDNGQFNNGSVSFRTALFGASITPPAPPPLPADAGACTPPNVLVALDATATITFNNVIDLDTITPFVTATAGGTPIKLKLTTMDNLNVTVAPDDMWPPNSTITISVDGMATDFAGDKLGSNAPSPQTFMTGAN